MRLVALAWALVFGTAVLTAGPNAPQEAREFTPKNGTFTIRFPAGVNSGHREKKLTIGKHEVTVELMQCKTSAGCTFTAGSIAMPAEVIRQIPPEKRFQVISEALIKPLKGKLLEGKEVKQGPVPGKDYPFECPAGRARMQVYLSGNWVLYAIVEGKSKEEVNSKEAEAFFASFKLSRQTKEQHPK